MSAVGTTPCKVQGEMRAKPDMKPWGNTEEGYNEPCKGDTPT